MPIVLGEHGCVTNAQVRTDLLDLSVWREVQGSNWHTRNEIAEEYQRRLHTTTAGTHTGNKPPSKTQLGKVRQGLARLIDSYAEGDCWKSTSSNPVLPVCVNVLTQLEEQRQQLIDVTALQTEIRLIVGRLEDFAARLACGVRGLGLAQQTRDDSCLGQAGGSNS